MRSGCYSDDPQIATVSAADSIQVQTALAGVGPETCYKVVLNRPGETATGYVLGDSLPAVAAFVKRREQESKEASEAQGRMPLTAPSGEKGPAKALDPNTPSHFAIRSEKSICSLRVAQRSVLREKAPTGKCPTCW